MVKSAYEPIFCSMKRLGRILLPPGWDASPSQGFPHVEKETCVLSQEKKKKHNPMSPNRARTRPARFGDERTNHEAIKTSTGIGEGCLVVYDKLGVIRAFKAIR